MGCCCRYVELLALSVIDALPCLIKTYEPDCLAVVGSFVLTNHPIGLLDRVCRIFGDYLYR